MEFGLREALLGLGVIGIVLIVLDGFRRKHQARRAERDDAVGSSDGEWDLFRGELLGGARVAGKSRADSDELDIEATLRIDSPVDTAPTAGDGVGKARRVSRAGEADPSADTVADGLSSGSEDATVDFSLGAADASAAAEEGDTPVAAEAPREEAPRVDFEDVIVINVMARPRDEISGNDLLRALLSVGLRYGAMNIFHRHEQITGKGSTLFSAVNIVEPGTFDLNRMEDFRTPGICLFMRLPGPKRSIYAFDQLVESARKISNMLGADLKDEHHSVLTPQTIEHYRQRVLDFERKMLSHRATQR
jgi:cell division protein ZipA